MNKFFTVLVVLAVFMTACSDGQFKGYTEDASGLKYKILFDNGDTTRANDGDIVVASINYLTLNDSSFSPQGNTEPIQIRMRESVYPGDIWAGLRLLGVGDSASFVTSVDSFFTVLSHSPIPEFLDSGSYFYMHVKVVDIMNQAEQQQKQLEQMAEMKKTEDAVIQKYLTDNNVSVAPDTNGIYITKMKAGKGKSVNAGDYAKINISFKVAGTDRDIYNTFEAEGGKGMEFLVGTGNFGVGIDKVLMQAKVGDKLSILTPSEMAFGARGAQGVIPPFSPIEYVVEVLDVTDAKSYEAKQQKIAEENKANESKLLAAYLKKNNITQQADADGMIKIINQEGSGEVVGSGKTVKVHYTGYLLDGTKFDSSVDRNTPFEVPVGAGRVIPGWDKGLASMKVGEKARFIIPSSLAYGPTGSGDRIPPFSTLVFDIEMIEIVK